MTDFNEKWDKRKMELLDEFFDHPQRLKEKIMTDKERLKRKLLLSWYRVQLGILEDIIFNYENGLKSFFETDKEFERNVKYVRTKNQEGYLPDDIHNEYVKESQEVWDHIVHLSDEK